MLSIVILAVLATAGASMLYMTRSTLTLHKQRRVAIELANSRIEELRASPYSSLTPLSGASVFLSAGTGTWNRTSSDPHEVITVGGLPFPIVTRASFGTGGTNIPAESLVLTADVTFGPRPHDHVALTTVQTQLD